MNYFDYSNAEDELSEITKRDFLFTKDTISLNDTKNEKLLASYAYNLYLQKQAKKNATNKKGGVPNE